MKRIDTPDATAQNLFTDGDVSQGVPATTVDASWANAVQEELANAIEGAGIALNPADDEQLLEAVLRLGSPWRSPVVNGDFRLWQRVGVVATHTNLPYAIGTTPEFVADRWRVRAGGSGGAATLDRGDFTAGQSDVPGNPEHYLEWDQTVAASGGRPLLEQPLEGVHTFAGETVTLSFYARVQSGSIDVRPNLRQDFGVSGSADVDHQGAEISVDTTWTRHQFTTTLGSISGKTIGADNYLALVLEPEEGSTFTLEVAELRLEPGSRATGFVRRPFEVELALCRRYFESSNGPHYAPDSGFGGLSRCLHDKATDDTIHGLEQRFRATKYLRDYNPGSEAPVDVTWYGGSAAAADTVSYDGADESLSPPPDQSTSLESTGAPTLSTPAGAASGLVVVLGRWAADAEIPA